MSVLNGANATATGANQDKHLCPPFSLDLSLWLRILTELKNKIIGYAMGDDAGSDLNCFTIQWEIERYFEDKPCWRFEDKHEFALVLLPKDYEVSGIACELLYRHSTAFVDAVGMVPHQTFQYPGLSVNKSLSELNITIGGFDTQFKFLTEIASNAIGFEGLKSIGINVDVGGLWDMEWSTEEGGDVKSAVDFLANNAMVFRVNSLRLGFQKQHGLLWDHLSSAWDEKTSARRKSTQHYMDELEGLVFKNIMIGSHDTGKPPTALEHSSFPLRSRRTFYERNI